VDATRAAAGFVLVYKAKPPQIITHLKCRQPDLPRKGVDSIEGTHYHCHRLAILPPVHRPACVAAQWVRCHRGR